MSEIKVALLSVHDKTGIVALAQFLSASGIRLVATGNTCETLKNAGLDTIEVAEYTGYPEIMSGRVKTLHPKVFAGILCNRADHEHEARSLGISNIDLVVANLYPFAEVVAHQGCKEAEAIEQIDIGGVSLLRAGGKNFRHVTVISAVGDYASLIHEMQNNSNATTLEYRKRLAAKAFALTATYDACIHSWLCSNEALPEQVVIYGQKVQNLRTGENPHQLGAFYINHFTNAPLEQLHGKELSFNNMVDIEAAVNVVTEFDVPAVSVIKHCNPCGAATSNIDILDAYDRAITCDQKSSFGGVIALNRKLTQDMAKRIAGVFIEVVVAPDFEDEALQTLTSKKGIRLIKIALHSAGEMTFKSVMGGFLLQERDKSNVTLGDFVQVTKLAAPQETLLDLLFAWKVCKHVKSNAIVIAKDGRAIGVGAGQMSRIDSVEIAIKKAHNCTGAVLASDAFFPFADSIKYSADAGICAIVQPGGSIRDQEVIDMANNSKIAMYFTGFRSFLH